MKWNRVKDILPESNKLCIVYVIRYEYPNYLDSDFIQDGIWHKNSGISRQVSHWMSFPDPPEEE